MEYVVGREACWNGTFNNWRGDVRVLTCSRCILYTCLKISKNCFNAKYQIKKKEYRILTFGVRILAIYIVIV